MGKMHYICTNAVLFLPCMQKDGCSNPELHRPKSFKQVKTSQGRSSELQLVVHDLSETMGHVDSFKALCVPMQNSRFKQFGNSLY